MKRTAPGRPPLDRNDPSVSIHVKLTTRQYDDVYRRAQRDRVSVPAIIRRDLRAPRRDDDGE